MMKLKQKVYTRRLRLIAILRSSHKVFPYAIATAEHKSMMKLKQKVYTRRLRLIAILRSSHKVFPYAIAVTRFIHMTQRTHTYITSFRVHSVFSAVF